MNIRRDLCLLSFSSLAMSVPYAYAQSGEACRGGFLACDDCFCGNCDAPLERDTWDLDSFSNRELMVIKLRFVVLKNDTLQLSAATPQQVTDQLGRLNEVFLPYKIQFIRGMTDTFANNATFYHFCTSGTNCWCLPECLDECMDLPQPSEGALKYTLSADPDKMLNIFVADMTNANGFKGLGYYPWCTYASTEMNGIIIDKAYFGGMTCGPGEDAGCDLLAHEVGHNLGLWHTFHPNICECESAACDGSCDPNHPECDLGGDMCCETPVSAMGSLLTCDDVTEGITDSCSANSEYGPADYTNYMDYALDGCWDHFTPQQARRMHCCVCTQLPGWIDSPDCNSNDIPDVCELTRGDADDCDANGVPDDCQPDCNNNYVADVCAIAEQISKDCDGNGIPDECHASTQQRACCHDGDQCTVMTALCCDELSGVFVGEQTTCMYGPCAMFGP